MKKELHFDEKELHLIAFKLGDEEYTVPIKAVQEIIMPQKATHIPKLPSFIEGVISLRGNVIPIIDGRKRFDLPIEGNSSEVRIMVLDLENHTMGLIVDSVTEVIHLKTDNINPPPVEFGEDNDFILGVGKYRERLLLLLDPAKFFDLKEVDSITKTFQAIKTTSETIEKIEENSTK